ncbi:hypothetical protein [Curtobacterium sp. MMLR14_006]|uniref:hypothetical protein n=1 Tax=Curtobacterium sp. MMLR14_006 TaxID=1898742 RepID=UPI0034A3DD79
MHHGRLAAPFLRFMRQAWPITAIAVAMLVVLAVVLRRADLGVYLALIAALRTPHAVVVTWMDRVQHTWRGRVLRRRPAAPVQLADWARHGGERWSTWSGSLRSSRGSSPSRCWLGRGADAVSAAPPAGRQARCRPAPRLPSDGPVRRRTRPDLVTSGPARHARRRGTGARSDSMAPWTTLST